MRWITATGLAVALSFGPASAQESLTLASPAPGPALINNFLKEWAETVSADSEGTLEIEVVVGGVLGRHGQMLDRAAMGVVDMTWDFQGYYPGQFALSSVVELPFQFESAENGSRAFQGLYDAGGFGGEYDGVHVLSLFTFPNASLMLRNALDDVSAMSGRRITAQNPTMQQAAERLGGVALNLTISDWYQALSRGTIDGAIVTFTAVPAFRLDEVVSEYIDVQLGGNPAMLIMDPARYESLPEPARAAIDAHSGVEFAQAMGAFLDDWNNNAKGFAARNGTNRVRVLDPSELEDWNARLTPLTDAWLEANPVHAEVRDAYLALLSDADG